VASSISFGETKARRVFGLRLDLGEFFLEAWYSIGRVTILREETMVLVLQGLTVYALVCMMIAAVVMLRNFNELVNKTQLARTRYGVFMVGLILVVMTSPFWLPGVVVRTTRALWQEIVKQCQLSDDDHP
jgi:hypothetical protein